MKNPISCALRYVQDCQIGLAGPNPERTSFQSVDEALEVLRQYSGKDFGLDAARWREWYRNNRWVFSRFDEMHAPSSKD